MKAMFTVLASTRLTVFLIVWLLISVIANAQFEPHWAWITPPLIALAMNLSAALIVTKKLRLNAFLLLFHLSLLSILVISGLNELMALKGNVEIVEGGEFTGTLDNAEAGPLVTSVLQHLRFKLLAMESNYYGDGNRKNTFARIQVTEPEAQKQIFIISDQHPFKYQGYRFYTTKNKGFAVLVNWQPNDSQVSELAAIHLPRYPANKLKQGLTWIPRGTEQELWMHLSFDKDPLASEDTVRFRPPEDARLVVRDDERYELKPGDTIQLDAGKLTYRGIRSWMGFHIQFDGLVSWLLAATLVAVLSLCGYLLQRQYESR